MATFFSGGYIYNQAWNELDKKGDVFWLIKKLSAILMKEFFTYVLNSLT